MTSSSVPSFDVTGQLKRGYFAALQLALHINDEFRSYVVIRPTNAKSGGPQSNHANEFSSSNTYCLCSSDRHRGGGRILAHCAEAGTGRARRHQIARNL